jgi:hypothetical protein
MRPQRLAEPMAADHSQAPQPPTKARATQTQGGLGKALAGAEDEDLSVTFRC